MGGDAVGFKAIATDLIDHLKNIPYHAPPTSKAATLTGLATIPFPG